MKTCWNMTTKEEASDCVRVRGSNRPYLCDTVHRDPTRLLLLEEKLLASYIVHIRVWYCCWPPTTVKTPQRYQLAPGQHIKYVGMCKTTLSSISSYWYRSTSSLFFQLLFAPFFTSSSFHLSQSRVYSPSHVDWNRRSAGDTEEWEPGRLHLVVCLNSKTMHLKCCIVAILILL